MRIYDPTANESDALRWAMTHAPKLADAVRNGIEHFDELRGEAGPNIDEYAHARLTRANAFLKRDYANVLSAWARDISAGDNS